MTRPPATTERSTHDLLASVCQILTEHLMPLQHIRVTLDRIGQALEHRGGSKL